MSLSKYTMPSPQLPEDSFFLTRFTYFPLNVNTKMYIDLYKLQIPGTSEHAHFARWPGVFSCLLAFHCSINNDGGSGITDDASDGACRMRIRASFVNRYR